MSYEAGDNTPDFYECAFCGSDIWTGNVRSYEFVEDAKGDLHPAHVGECADELSAKYAKAIWFADRRRVAYLMARAEARQ